MNGFGAQGPPRGADVPNPVSYPFRSFDGSTTFAPAALGRARLRHQRRRRRPLRPLSRLDRGPADAGGRPDRPRPRPRCRGLPADVGARRAGSRGCAATAGASASSPPAGSPRRLQLGDRPKRVLKRAGQPVSRTRTWRFCANGRRQAKRAGEEVGQQAGGRGLQPARPSRADRLDPAQAPRRRPAGRDAGERAAKAAPSASARLWVRDAGDGRKFVYGVREGGSRTSASPPRRGGQPGDAEALPEARADALSAAGRPGADVLGLGRGEAGRRACRRRSRDGFCSTGE